MSNKKEIDIPCTHCGVPVRVEIQTKVLNGECECGHIKQKHNESGICCECRCLIYEEKI